MQIMKIRGPVQWLRVYFLYRSAFPKNERKPFSMIAAKWKAGETDIWYAERNGKFAGMAVTINGEDLILIDYFAVPKKRRGNGCGSEFLPLVFGQYPGKGIFLEIESTLSEHAGEQSRKRKQFYLNCGFRDLQVSVDLFGVEMELLGIRCSLDYAAYRNFYGEHLGEYALKHIERVER